MKKIALVIANIIAAIGLLIIGYLFFMMSTCKDSDGCVVFTLLLMANPPMWFLAAYVNIILVYDGILFLQKFVKTRTGQRYTAKPNFSREMRIILVILAAVVICYYVYEFIHLMLLILNK